MADSYPVSELQSFLYGEFGNSIRKHFSVLDEKEDFKSVLHAVESFQNLCHFYQKCNLILDIDYQGFKQDFQSKIFCLICNELEIEKI